MSGNCSPLRYPGGKTKLYDVVKEILMNNNLIGGTYVEPFAGGAGLAIKLLLNRDVNRIILNDIDPAIYYFWKVILESTEAFCDAISQAEMTVDEWKKQREIFKRKNYENELEFAFSVFYLNRTNVSGILSGGVIGGLEQKGVYKIDARFNKERLIKKIRQIAARKKDIVLYNLDAIELVSGRLLNNYHKIFINFDPPYVNKGAQLYRNSFNKNKHVELFECIRRCKKKWIVTYDVSDFIGKLYQKYRCELVTVAYSAKNRVKKKEYMFFSNNLNVINKNSCGGNDMKCVDECRFCCIQKGERIYEIIDSPLMENDSYYLLSSVGALVEGWTLLIPKRHEYSMKKHYAEGDFFDYANKCISLIKKAYGVDRVIVFEHGANRFGSMTACGTNHSHLHIVPMKESLLKDIRGSLAMEKLEFSQVEDYVKESEYLLYADVADKIELTECYIHILEEPISQFFRRIIANKIGCPERYNYREYSNLDVSIDTVNKLKREMENGEERC